jgi:hypothetical protein
VVTTSAVAITLSLFWQFSWQQPLLFVVDDGGVVSSPFISCCS